MINRGAWPMRAVGGRSAIEREGRLSLPEASCAVRTTRLGQAAWPVSTGLRWPHRHVRGADGMLPGAPGLGGAAAGLRLCLEGDENILELDSGDAT